MVLMPVLYADGIRGSLTYLKSAQMTLKSGLSTSQQSRLEILCLLWHWLLCSAAIAPLQLR